MAMDCDKNANNMSKHNCKEVADNIYLLLDGELGPEEEKRLIAEVKKCSHCLEHYNLDKTFKDFVKAKMEKKCCSEALKSEIKSKIAQL